MSLSQSDYDLLASIGANIFCIHQDNISTNRILTKIETLLIKIEKNLNFEEDETHK